MLGPSGQEELAKRLAELELSRELPDDLAVDDQDWFDEDFGLSSRRGQQCHLLIVFNQAEVFGFLASGSLLTY